MLLNRVVATLVATAVSVGGGCNDVGGSYNRIVSIDKILPIPTIDYSFNNGDAGGGSNAVFVAMSPSFHEEDGGGVDNSTSISFDVADISFNDDTSGLTGRGDVVVDLDVTSRGVSSDVTSLGDVNLNVTPLSDVKLDMTSFKEEFPYNTISLSSSDNAVGSSISDPLSSSINSTSSYTHDSLGIIITYGFHREHMEWKYDRVLNNDYCRRMYFGYYRWWKPFCKQRCKDQCDRKKAKDAIAWYIPICIVWSYYAAVTLIHRFLDLPLSSGNLDMTSFAQVSLVSIYLLLILITWLLIPVLVPSEHPPEDNVYGAEFGARVRQQIRNEHLFLGVIRHLGACLGMMALVIDVYIPIPAAMCWLIFIPAISPPVKFPKRVRDNFFAMYLYMMKNTIKCLLAAVMCIPSMLLELLYWKANGTGSTIGLIMCPVVVMKRLGYGLGYAMCRWCDGCFDSIIMKMLCLRSPVKKKYLRHRSSKSRRQPSSRRSSSEPSSEPSSSARASTMPSSHSSSEPSCQPYAQLLLGCGILLMMKKILSWSALSCQPSAQLLGCGILLLLLLMKILSWMLLSTQKESSTHYKKGERVMYSKDGSIWFTMATVLEVHLDDHLRPYYVVQVDGKDTAVDTIGSNLSPVTSHGVYDVVCFKAPLYMLTCLRSLLSKFNWGRLFDITTYWLILSYIGNYSHTMLETLVKVFSALAFYRSRAQHRMYIFLLCCFSWSSFAQAVDAEFGDEDGFYDAHFGGYNYEDNQGWNEEQSNAFVHAMGICLNIAIDLFNSNQLFVPSSIGHWFPVAGAFALDKLAQLGETSDSVIYAFARKVGHAWDGKVRKKWYQNVAERIFVVFNLDHQRGEQHASLVNSILNFCMECCNGISPDNLADMTIADAIELEGSGLPFCARLFFYSMAYDVNHILGGAKATYGFLRRIILSCVESGVQRLFPYLGFDELETNSMPHEFVTGYGLMDWVKASHEKCVDCGAAFFKKLKDTFGDLDSSSDGRVNYDGSFIDYVLKNGIKMIALSSWAANIKCLPLTKVILDLMFGSWRNAFGDRIPPEDRPFDAGSYNDGDRNFAFDNFLAFVKCMEDMFASFGALDTNEEMLKASKAGGKSLVEILEERGWNFFFSFADFGLDIDVYFYQKEDGYWPSFIFIHRPPCFAFNTESTTLTKKMIDLMRKRVVELHFLFLFSRKFLKEMMSDGFNVSIDLRDYTVLYNLLMAHAMFQYLIANFHLNTKYACLFAKNMLVSFNAFLADVTVGTTKYINGYYCENNNEGLVSVAARGEAARTTSSDQTRDRHFVQTVLNIITRCFTSKCPLANVEVLSVKECFSQVVELLKDTRMRWEYLKERNVIGGPLLKGLTKAWSQSNGSAKPATQDKKDEAQQRMEGKTGWPVEWPTGLSWIKEKRLKNGKWRLKKTVHWYQSSWWFHDTEKGLLAAANMNTRFKGVMTNDKKKIVKDAKTEEEKNRLRNIIAQHCRVTEGESCDCAWCNDSNANPSKRRKL